MVEVTKAVIPAAGLGTRFLPATKAMPKEMLPLVDKPTIQFVVEEAIHSGIKDILIITGRGKRAVEDHFDKNFELEEILRKKDAKKLLEEIAIIPDDVDMHYTRQGEPLGLGHAVLCAEKHVDDEPFVVMLGDTIVLDKGLATKKLIELYGKLGESVVGIEEVPKEDVSRYGIIKPKPVEDRLYEIKDMVEKPPVDQAPSNLSFFGRYLLHSDIFKHLRQTQPGYSGEIQLTDGMKLMLKERKIYGYLLQSRRYDIGKRLYYLEAFVDYALARDDMKEQVKEYLRGLNL